MKTQTVIVKIKANFLWASCAAHHEWLIQSYSRLNEGSIIQIEYDPQNPQEISKLFESLPSKFASLRIALIDPSIECGPILSTLVRLKHLNDVEILFHLYGDLPLRIKSFVRSLNSFQSQSFKVRLKFVVPSTRVARAMASIIGSRKGIFVQRLKIRLPQKTKAKPFLYNSFLPLSPGHIFGYFGRIEFSKNLHLIIKAFANQEIYSNSTLLVAGNLDFTTKVLTNGISGIKFLKLLKKALRDLNSCARERIIFLGNLPENQLGHFLNSLDTGLFLSTYQGEVFGIGNCQALSLSVPCLATDWGGHSDNAKVFEQQTLLPVHYSKKSETYYLNDKILTKFMKLRMAHASGPSKSVARKRVGSQLSKNSIKKIVSSPNSYMKLKCRQISTKKWLQVMSGK